MAVINAENYTTPALCNYSFAGLCSWLNDNECVALFNHPGRYNASGHEFDHFTSTPTNRFVGIELWNRTQRFPTFYYTDGYFRDDGNKSWYDEALERGWRIGASGSEDNHTGDFGTTTFSRLAVLASENSRRSIYEALKARRFFSTYDKNMALSFKISGSEMGSEVYAGMQTLEIKAMDGDGELFIQVDLLKNGELIQSWYPNSPEVDISQELKCAHGDHYYIRVKQQDSDEAITSPIWISKVNRLPGAMLLQPLPNTDYLTPASVTLLAVADDADGSIEKVEFYQESKLLGECVTSPYSYTWESGSTGTYHFKVKATDNLEGTGESRDIKIVVTNPGEPVTLSSQIATGMDDVEESGEGSISGNMRSTDIELVDDYGTRGENQTVGLRFIELNISKGVYITHAYVQFTCDEVSMEPCHLTITGEATDNSGEITRDPYNISTRQRTSAQVLWSPDSWPVEKEAGSAQQTPDLSSIIKEIITRPGYDPLGAITLIFNGSGTRTAFSYEGSPSQAAVLFVTYSLTPLNKPPIVSLLSPLSRAEFMAPAMINLQADADDEDGTVEKVNFYEEDNLLGSDDTPPYTLEWGDVTEGSYLLKAVATDNKGDTATSKVNPVLVHPQVISRTFTARIASAPDDAEESARGTVSLTGDDIKLVYGTHGIGSQTVGLRFTHVAIPKGAVITRACIRFTSDEKSTTLCTLKIEGENADYSSSFSNAKKDISGRSRTKAVLGWIPSGWLRPDRSDMAEQTPDLKSIVQEIIDRSGWSEGNSLSFIFTGLGIGNRIAASFETSVLKAADLVVNYEVTIHRNK